MAHGEYSNITLYLIIAWYSRSVGVSNHNQSEVQLEAYVPHPTPNTHAPQRDSILHLLGTP